MRLRDPSLGSSVELREPVVLMLTEKSKWKTHKDESTEAGHWGGPVRSSEEAAVMGVERRDWVRQYFPYIQLSNQEELTVPARPFKVGVFV